MHVELEFLAHDCTMESSDLSVRHQWFSPRFTSKTGDSLYWIVIYLNSDPLLLYLSVGTYNSHD